VLVPAIIYSKLTGVKKILLLLLLIVAVHAGAQKFGQKLSGGFNAALGLPSGEFKDVNDNVAFGLRGHIMYNFSRKVPVHAGLELGYGTMGNSTQYFYDPYGGFYDQYSVTASSNIFSLQLKLRLQQPRNMAVNPFAEAIIGWNDFFSTVNVERVTSYGPSYGNDNYGNSSDAKWSMTYGGAAGLDIRLQKQGNLWLEVKTAYMLGRKTIYYTDPHIASNGQAYFTENESETNMIIPQVGVKFGL
jgi:hypothetical protein